jgi:hypothetical protein
LSSGSVYIASKGTAGAGTAGGITLQAGSAKFEFLNDDGMDQMIIGTLGESAVTSYIHAREGSGIFINGRPMVIEAGNARDDSGAGNGGDLTLRSGAHRSTGTPGNVILDSLAGYLIISTIPTSSAGLPSGAVWSNSGVLTIV